MDETFIIEDTDDPNATDPNATFVIDTDERNKTFIIEQDDDTDWKRNINVWWPEVPGPDEPEKPKREPKPRPKLKWEPVWSIPIVDGAEDGPYDYKWYEHLNKEAQGKKFGITKVAWSNNNLKLAIATTENEILLYDDRRDRRDRFSLKAVDPMNGKKSFTVTGLAFSTDSGKLAVAQSDGVVFVYDIGYNWYERKGICNTFIEQSAVTCLHWLFEGPIIYGLLNGQVRLSNVNSNKSKTLYNTKSLVVSLAGNSQGTGFLSGHMDGEVFRCYVKFDRKPEEEGLVIRIKSPPFSLTWVNDFIMAAGDDPAVFIFTNTGELHKEYDYTDNEKEAVFLEACASPSARCVAFGCYQGVRCYSWKPGKQEWEEDTVKKIPGLADITCLAWKEDGTRLTVGTSFGVCDIYEPALRRMVYNKKIEISYVGPNHVMIHSLVRGMKGVTFTSMTDNEIEEVRVMGNKDQYVVARTAETLIVVNLEKGVLSEITWPPSIPEERFIFRYPSVFLIYRQTQLTVVEYGKNEILMSVGADIVKTSLISVRINERKPNNNLEYKRLGYMLDKYTVCIMDLVISKTIAVHRHHTKVNWLELNETGGKLLFRDRRRSVYVLDSDYNTCTHIIHLCTFVQWLEGSNAVVGQSRSTLYIWYNVNFFEEMKSYKLPGQVLEVLRDKNRLIVVTDGCNDKLYFDMDVSRLDFETAIGDKQLLEAHAILELQSGFTRDLRHMYRLLGRLALEMFDFGLALECYGKLLDMPRIRFVEEMEALAESGDKNFSVEWDVRLALFDNDLEGALKIYRKKNDVEGAVNLCIHYRLWEEAYDLASGLSFIKMEEFRKKYISHLVANKRYRRAAEISERHGELNAAFFYYFRGGSIAKAARIMIVRKQLLNNRELTEMVLDTLKKNQNYRVAGEIYEKLNRLETAYQMYYTGSEFCKAIELARRLFPKEVTRLEDKWGDHLMRRRHIEEAVNHYIVAGKTYKALAAAVIGQLFRKAAEIIRTMEDLSKVIPAIQRTAQYYTVRKEYSIAEELLASADLWIDALDMYEHAGEWTRIKKMAEKYRYNEQLIDLCNTRAIIYSQEGRLPEAEVLFLAIGETDSAISMYKDHQRYDEMLRMVSAHHPDLLRTTHYHLGQKFENDGQYERARYHYIEIDDFSSVIRMYQRARNWEKAYAAAKRYSNQQTFEYIAYLWAMDIPRYSAVKLLKKLNALESSIDYACADSQFEFALYIATRAAPDKVSDVHYKRAMALEDDGKFEEAEEYFLKANKPREAVLMHMHSQNYTSALRLTERYMPDSVKDVLEGQAKAVFEKRQYNLFERLLLRAGRPDLIVKIYKEAGMWKDAMKAGKAFLPYTHMEDLREEYEQAMADIASNKPEVDKIIMKAEDYEKKQQYEKAVDCYLKVDEHITPDVKLLLMAWKTAAEVSISHLDKDQIKMVAKVLGPKFKKIKKYKLAVQLYLAGGMLKDGLDTYISVGAWKRAKKLAQETDASYVTYVEKIYTEVMKHGSLEKMMEHREKDKELRATLDELIQQNEWEKVLDLVEEHELKDLLTQYVGRYAIYLIIQRDSPCEALDLLLKYNAPASESILFVYKKLVIGLMYAIRWAKHDAYREWASLRTLLFRLIQNMKNPASGFEAGSINDFEALLLIIHYVTAREAYRLDSSLQLLVAKISSALLRYIQVIPLDRAFFEAGMDNRLIGNEQEGFLYLNHFVDLFDAIREGTLKYFDDAYLEYTDVPTKIPLPSRLFIDGGCMYEEVKEWIINQCVDKTFDFFGLLDDRKLLPHALKPRHEDVEEEDEGDEVVKEIIPGREPCSPCIVSGYPILLHHGEQPLKFRKQGVFAIPEEWQLLCDAARENPIGPVYDVLAFIVEWCGKPVN